MQRVRTHIQGFKAFIGSRSRIKLDFISILFCHQVTKVKVLQDGRADGWTTSRRAVITGRLHAGHDETAFNSNSSQQRSSVNHHHTSVFNYN